MTRISLRPLGLAPWFAPLPLFAAITAVSSRQSPGYAYDLWAQASQACHASLGLTGPLLMLWSSLLAASAAGRAWVFSSSMPRTVGARQYVRVVAITAVLGTAAHGVGLVPRLVFATQTATYGHLYLASVAIVVAWVIIFCATGAIFGVLLSHARWLIPIPILASLLMFALPVYAGLEWGTLQPNSQWVPHAGTVPSWAVTAMVVALAIVLVCACLFLAGFGAPPVLALGRKAVRLPNPGFLVAASTAVALVGAAVAADPPTYVEGPPVVPVCASANDADVCLHPAVVKSYPAVEDAVNRLSPVGMSTYARTVRGASLPAARSTHPDEELVVGLSPDITGDEVLLDVFYDTMQGACRAYVVDPDSPYSIASSLTSKAAQLAGLAHDEPVGSDAAGEAVAAMSRPEFAAFMAEHRHAIRGCTVKPADLR